MTRPRREIVCLDRTTYYHCSNRCVKHAYLCGKDPLTGTSYAHRRQWIVERLRFLAEVFSIHIAAYAIMSNHYHIVVHIDLKTAQSWSDDEVIERWQRLYRGSGVLQKKLRGEYLDIAEQRLLSSDIARWRSELSNISKFMGCLNEHIAKRANAEDQCTGRFWQGRFESQALLDDTAILTCMTYVDLNPIRAGICDNLDEANFTSIQQRIKERRSPPENNPDTKPKHKDTATKHTIPLMPFVEAEKLEQQQPAICHSLKEYIELVEWTGRHVREDKPGFICSSQPVALSQIGLSNKQWKRVSERIQTCHHVSIDSQKLLRRCSIQKHHTEPQKKNLLYA